MTKEEWEVVGQFVKDVVGRFDEQEKITKNLAERIKHLEEQIEILSELKQFSHLLDMDGMRNPE
jgi:hypothetical protein